jgi:hypothetical protein
MQKIDKMKSLLQRLKEAEVENDFKTWLEIQEQLRGMTIERIKRKGARYSYFIANNDGEKMKTIHKTYVNGKELTTECWQFEYEDTTPTYTKTEQIVRDYGLDDSYIFEHEEKYGGETVQLKCIIDNYGDVVLDGIVDIISWEKDSNVFHLELHSEFNEDVIEKSRRLGRLSVWRENIYCVFDAGGPEFEIEPTTNRIFFNRETKRYQELL